MIYFIQGATTRLIKVGKAADCQDRLSDLQTGSPDKLHLLKEVYTDDYAAEKILHRRFRYCRAHGEWFFPDEKLIRFMEQLPLSFSIPDLVVWLNEDGIQESADDVNKESRRRDKMGPGFGTSDFCRNRDSGVNDRVRLKEAVAKSPRGRWDRVLRTMP